MALQQEKRAYCDCSSSPKFERASVPLPEADGSVSAGRGQVALRAATERRKLQAKKQLGYH